MLLKEVDPERYDAAVVSPGYPSYDKICDTRKVMDGMLSMQQFICVNGKENRK